MPTATNDGVSLYYETTGSGETVAFIGEAGIGAWQWGWQYDHVGKQYEALVWDLRGTGRSDAPEGPYTVETFAGDLETVLATANARRVHLVGVGMGGMVAMKYGREYARARSMTLINTAASGRDVDVDVLGQLFASPSDEREDRRLPGAFSDDVLSSQERLVDDIARWRSSDDADASAFQAQCQAMDAFEAGPLHELTLPALVLHGVDDPVVPLATGRALADGLPRGTFEAVEGRHLCFIEHSRAVTDRLLEFLDSVDDADG